MREKLIDLLVEFIEVDVWDNGEFIEKEINFGKIADYLIANGVTLDYQVASSKWIPVTERLPEKDGKYLVYKYWVQSGWCDVVSFAKDGRKIDEYDFQREWENVWYGYSSEWGYVTYDSITHWMPLPETPKED